jgi:hypothetical protein
LSGAAGLPALLLVSVALLQIALAHTVGLSPWKGGGFGMFSTTDRAEGRYLRVFVRAPGRHEELRLAPELRDPATRAAVLPTTARLERLARDVGRHERRAGRPATTVRVEVWRAEFDGETLIGHARQLRAVVLALDGPGV